jgi:hypothetical protein
MRPLLLLAVLLAVPAGAQANPAEDQTPILRCLIATSLLGQSEDKALASAGTMGSLYWLGRLDSSLSEDEIENRITAISDKLTQADIRLDLQRCGTEMQQRGDMMQRIGAKLKQRAAKGDSR